MIDSLYKLSRKMLSPDVYSKLQELIGRKRIYYNFSHFNHIVEGYKANISLKDKIVLEFGQGNDIGTGLLLILNGAKKVYLVDQKNIYTTHGNRNNREYATQIILEYIKANNLNPTLVSEAFIDNILSKVEMIDSFLCRDILNILSKNSIDYVLSHKVLEHVNDLDTIFYCVDYLLKDNGAFYSKVDLSDHSYHIFGKYPLLNFILERNVFSHLSYSNKMWSILNDVQHLNMNRELLPTYLNYIKKYKLKIIEIELYKSNSKCIIHKDIINGIHGEWDKRYIYNVAGFSFFCRKSL